MYQTLNTFNRILLSIQSLMRHPDTALWIDIVKAALPDRHAARNRSSYLP